MSKYNLQFIAHIERFTENIKHWYKYIHKGFNLPYIHPLRLILTQIQAFTIFTSLKYFRFYIGANIFTQVILDFLMAAHASYR